MSRGAASFSAKQPNEGTKFHRKSSKRATSIAELVLAVKFGIRWKMTSIWKLCWRERKHIRTSLQSPPRRRGKPHLLGLFAEVLSSGTWRKSSNFNSVVERSRKMPRTRKPLPFVWRKSAGSQTLPRCSLIGQCLLTWNLIGCSPCDSHPAESRDFHLTCDVASAKRGTVTRHLNPHLELILWSYAIKFTMT